MSNEIQKNLRYNFAVNVTDGTFFGLGLGFSSFVTVIPLFIDSLTDYAFIIGLVASFLNIGWQLPQLFTAGIVARLRRYKPMVLLMTLNERLPFFALALVALLVPVIGNHVALVLAVLFVAWQGIGGGLTATAWQSMISKIIPDKRRGSFYGIQSLAANAMISLGSLLSGIILSNMVAPGNFALCFFITGVFMMISLHFLARTREPEHEVDTSIAQHTDWAVYRRRLVTIVREDSNFRWFIISRMLVQFGIMAVSFFTVYAVRQFGIPEQTAGAMAGLLTASQAVSSPIMGWMGDRWGHRNMLTLGALAVALSAFVAMTATGVGALYLAFALAGIAYSMQWTTAIAITAEFGLAHERPYYIGLSNTLISPATLFAPIIGGLLADTFGFGATFTLAILCGIATVTVLQVAVRDPRRVVQPVAAVGIGTD